MRRKFVDTSIGTVGDEKAESFHGGGKTYPGAVLPFGMVQMSPDTVTGGDNGTGYNYCHSTVEGFSINHMSGIGWYGDLGNLQIMPVCGDTDLRSGTNEEVPFNKGTVGWRSEFSHEDEITEAGYYSVKLARYGITAEATADIHSGFLRFTYCDPSDARLIFNFSRRIAGHSDIQRVSFTKGNRFEGEIVCTPNGGGFGRGRGGIGYSLYFVTEISAQVKRVRFFENEELITEDVRDAVGTDLGAVVELMTNGGSVTVKTAISYVDLDGARRNFEAEAARRDFDSALENARESWEDALSCITVDGGTDIDTKIFYTCLYHTLLDPRSAEDTDGRYRMGDTVSEKGRHTQRTMFSGWDVYRSEFPLLTLISPRTVSDEVNTLLTLALHNGTSFPRWELMGHDSGCMIGDPGVIVAADAVTKGICDFDVETAYELSKASCTAKSEFRQRAFKSLHPSIAQYQNGAYVPGSLSETLEFLVADYAMHRFAKALGKEDDSSYYLARAMRYVENYDPKLGFMSPRDENGAFADGLDRYSVKGCTESNIYQQSWYVPYDVNGLFELFGRERAVDLLGELFEKADLGALWNENYNHSNEPCHNLTHYFAAAGLPHRTQYLTRRVQKESYRTGAFGFCGNEDVGQLSAWYVLSAVGFAQLCMADGKYYFNTPLFKRITLKLDGHYHKCSYSDTLSIVCDRDPNEFPYIKAVKFNGETVTEQYLTYEQLTSGGTVEFILSKEAE